MHWFPQSFSSLITSSLNLNRRNCEELIQMTLFRWYWYWYWSRTTDATSCWSLSWKWETTAITVSSEKYKFSSRKKGMVFGYISFTLFWLWKEKTPRVSWFSSTLFLLFSPLGALFFRVSFFFHDRVWMQRWCRNFFRFWSHLFREQRKEAARKTWGNNPFLCCIDRPKTAFLTLKKSGKEYEGYQRWGTREKLKKKE